MSAMSDLQQEVDQAADKIAALLEGLTGRAWKVVGTLQHASWQFAASSEGSFECLSPCFDIRQGKPISQSVIGGATVMVYHAWVRVRNELRHEGEE